MNIIGFGASNASQSINKKLAHHTVQLFDYKKIELLDLNDFQMPIYSIDNEINMGKPKEAFAFLEKLKWADLIVISLAEHNGSYTSAFKNIFDWVSRIEVKMFLGKKLLLLSTSTGARGGKSVMDAALSRFPIHGAEIVAHFCLPTFNENFEHIQNHNRELTLVNSYFEMIDSVKNKLSK